MPYVPTPETRALLSTVRKAIFERMKTELGFLYVAEVIDTAKIKIGYSGDVSLRVKELNYRGYKNQRYRLIASIRGTRAQELALHRRIRHLRSPGYGGASEYYPRTILTHEAIPAGLRTA